MKRPKKILEKIKKSLYKWCILSDLKITYMDSSYIITITRQNLISSLEISVWTCSYLPYRKLIKQIKEELIRNTKCISLSWGK